MPKTAFTKNIEMTLDDDSIDAAIRKIQEFRQELKDGMQALVEDLMESGVLQARMTVAAMHAVDTGALMASIGHGAFDPETGNGVIYAGGYYAIFVEFGTGVVGAEHPHPGLQDGSVNDFAVLGANGSVYNTYDTNGHGEKGWWYKPVGSKRFRWTKGMPARPFMYHTFRSLEQFAEFYGGSIIADFVWE